MPRPEPAAGFGLDTRQAAIALELSISIRTVEMHGRHIRAKLKLDNALQAGNLFLHKRERESRLAAQAGPLLRRIAELEEQVKGLQANDGSMLALTG